MMIIRTLLLFCLVFSSLGWGLVSKYEEYRLESDLSKSHADKGNVWILCGFRGTLFTTATIPLLSDKDVIREPYKYIVVLVSEENIEKVEVERAEIIINNQNIIKLNFNDDRLNASREVLSNGRVSFSFQENILNVPWEDISTLRIEVDFIGTIGKDRTTHKEVLHFKPEYWEGRGNKTVDRFMGV